MDQDGDNVLFASLGGQAPDPEAVLASDFDGWAPQQRSRDFLPATILTRRDVLTSLVDLPRSADNPYDLRSS
jgi:hypothetical protein